MRTDAAAAAAAALLLRALPAVLAGSPHALPNATLQDAAVHTAELEQTVL